ncbi:MAG: LysR substrate-binding domain-containing protein, partial [Kiloniellales bacterium]|nr:LysR substrate-binding domain-containing protein [Kiloniellales bacterium]
SSRHLNFRQVEAFKTVFECGSMTLAGERLNISQPAVSKLVAALERRIGFALFDRRAGKLLPTAEGQLFYEDTERALIGIESLAEKAEDIRERRYGRLAVGAMPALSWGLIQEVIAEIVTVHPDVAVSMQTRTSPQLLNLVSARQLDVAALAHLGRNPMVHVESLHRIPMVCAVPAGHRLADSQIIHARDIADEALIALSTLDQTRQRIEVVLMNEGIRPKIQIDTALAASACAFTAKGLGVAIVEPFSTAVFSNADIVVRPFEPTIEMEIAVVRPQELEPAPSSLTREFITMLGAALDRGVQPDR